MKEIREQKFPKKFEVNSQSTIHKSYFVKSCHEIFYFQGTKPKTQVKMTFRLFFPNFLSILKILLVPLVFFLPESFRFPILIIGGIVDFFDGYLARRWHVETSFGAFIDPVGDKGLALAYSFLYYREGSLHLFELGALFSRDFALILFSLCLFMMGSFSAWKIRSFFSGKMATLFQGIVFVFITLNLNPPAILYYLLYVLGGASFFELLSIFKQHCPVKNNKF